MLVMSFKENQETDKVDHLKQFARFQELMIRKKVIYCKIINSVVFKVEILVVFYSFLLNPFLSNNF